MEEKKMKKIILAFVLLIVFCFKTSVYASTEESSKLLPKGVNYFNSENFKLEGDNLSNIYPFRVRPNTLYTFLFYCGPQDRLDLKDILINDGICDEPMIYIKTENLTFNDKFIHDKAVPAGASSYFCFTTDKDDDYIEEIKFPIPRKSRNKEIWKDSMFLFEGTENIGFIDSIPPYEDPIPPLEDVIHDQAIYEGIYYVSYDDVPTQEDIKKLLQATDNNDGDISDSIYLESSIYEGKMEPVGEYKMVYAVKDSSGNKTTFTITLRVLDIKAPKIIGPDSLIVNVGAYDLDDYKEFLTIRDNFDDNCKLSIKSSNLDKMTPGIYDIVFEASDSSNNVSTFTMHVRVHDNYAPVITASSIVLNLDEANKLTIDEIKEIIASRVKNSSDNIKIVYNDYQNNESIKGEYRIEYLYEDGDSKKSGSVKILVGDSKSKKEQKTGMYIGIGVASLIVIGVMTYIFVKKFKKK